MALVLAFLGSIVGSVFAQDCSNCKGQGWVKCPSKDHVAKKVCGVTWPHRCSVIWRAKCCRGQEKIVCPKCKSAEAAQAIKAESRERRAWSKKMALIDVDVATKFIHVETENFLLHSCVPEWRFKKKGKLDRIKAAHKFAEQLEGAAARFKEVVGVLPNKPQEIYLLWDVQEMMKATKLVAGQSSRHGYRAALRDGHSAWLGYPSFEALYTPQGWHAYIYHHAIHSMVWGIGRLGAGPNWLEYGLAHWFELDAFEGKKYCNFYCSSNLNSDSPWSPGTGWRKKLQKDMKKDRAPTLAELINKKTDEHDTRSHVYSYSVVAYIIKKHPKKIGPILQAMKTGSDFELTIEEHLGLKMTGFEKAWKKFVKRGVK